MAKKQTNISENIIEIVDKDDIPMIIDEAIKKGQYANYYKNSNVVVIGENLIEVSKIIYEHEKK